MFNNINKYNGIIKIDVWDNSSKISVLSRHRAHDNKAHPHMVGYVTL